MASLKKNYFLYLTRTIINLLFPLITFPYVCRVLGPEGQGKVTYISSIIALFTMFSQLGIPIYGLRECSKINDDKQKLKQFIAEISVIQLFTCGMCTIIYFAYVFFIVKTNTLLFFIYLPQIFFNTFVYDYYFTAKEEQRFITVRYVIVKIIEIVLLFFFVHGKNALIIYGFLINFVPVLVFLVNLAGLKDLLKERLNKLELKKHIKPIIVIFLATVAVSLYCNLDNVMLGSMINDEAVGYYGTANKIVRIIINVATATSAVLYPRLQKSLKVHDWNNYGKYSRDYICYTLIFSIPATIGLALLANGIIYITAGAEFAPSAFSMQLLCPILVIVPMANFFGGMILMVNDKESYYTISVTIAAVVNLISNYYFIPKFAQNGAIIGTIIAESVGLCLEIIFSRKYLKGIYDCLKNIWSYIFAAIIMWCVVFFFLKISELTLLVETLLACFIGIISYSLILFILREDYFIYCLGFIKAKVHK